VLLSARLHRCLPQVVVDIIEEKMEQEYRVGAMSLLKHINSTQVLSNDHNDDYKDDDDDDDDDVRIPIVSGLLSFRMFWHIFFEK